MSGETSMDVSLTEQQYGPVRTNVGEPTEVRPRGFHGSESYFAQPYPTSNVTHNHTFGLLADHHSMLESRIFALETRVNAMQKKMDEWDEWYKDWNPLLQLLYKIFKSFLWKPRYGSTDSAGSDAAV